MQDTTSLPPGQTITCPLYPTHAPVKATLHPRTTSKTTCSTPAGPKRWMSSSATKVRTSTLSQTCPTHISAPHPRSHLYPSPWTRFTLSLPQDSVCPHLLKRDPQKPTRLTLKIICTPPIGPGRSCAVSVTELCVFKLSHTCPTQISAAHPWNHLYPSRWTRFTLSLPQDCMSTLSHTFPTQTSTPHPRNHLNPSRWTRGEEALARDAAPRLDEGLRALHFGAALKKGARGGAVRKGQG